MKLADTYQFISSRLDDILMTPPQEWLYLRNQPKSVAEAERKWELTDNGKLEFGYRNQLKTCDRMMSAIKTRLEIVQGEARNQY